MDISLNFLIKCDVCGRFIDKKYLESHNGGRKHQKKLKKLSLSQQEIIDEDDKSIKPIVTMNDSKISNKFEGKMCKRKLEELGETPELFISGFPKAMSKENILQYFSQFGYIEMAHVRVSVRNVSIQYEHKHEAEKVMNMVHIIDGKKLNVKWLKQTTFFKLFKKAPDEIEMLLSIENIPVFDLQLSRFMKCINPDLKQLESQEKLKCEVAQVLSQDFPSCMVCLVGSTATYLQFKTSNIDIFVDIENNPENLQKVKNALEKSRLFKNVFISHTIKVPFYVGCRHVETDFFCTVIFKEVLAVKTSELIRYFINLDKKVRPFILMVKYWGKTHYLSNIKKSLRNYSLVMMCIFYLQQKHSFPSVKELQNGTCPTDSSTIWNMNISKITTYSKNFELNTSMRLLLLGFFEFYADFSFDSYIISPYMGKPIEKALFSNESTVPKEFYIYKQNLSTIEPLPCDTPICLQDPFAHNVNTCKTLVHALSHKFVIICKVAQSKLSQDDETNMLNELLSEYEEIVPNPYSVCIRRNINCSPAEETDLWLQRVKDFLSTIFQRILKLNMKEIDAEAQKSVKYKATCYMDLWTTRDVYSEKISEKLEQCRTILGREIIMTDYMWGKSATESINSVLFESYIHVSFHEKPPKVNIRFELIKENGFGCFDSFFNFFKSVLSSWFGKYEKELDEIFCLI